jgi:uncharacterized protein
MNSLVTHEGVTFDFEHPRAEMIQPEDLAHSLANQCRFAGHVRQFYSVAQHLVLCSTQVPERDALPALLHDAQEAYVVDLPRYLKRCPGMEAYRSYENLAQLAVMERFGVTYPLPPSIGVVDLRMVLTEWRDLMPKQDSPCLPEHQEVFPYDFKIVPWSADRAELEFTYRLRGLWKVWRSS